MFLSIQRASYLSFFSELPGLQRASKATIEVFSIKASLMRHFIPKSEILLPEMFITFK
jgi:hypothetical protein